MMVSPKCMHVLPMSLPKSQPFCASMLKVTSLHVVPSSTGSSSEAKGPASPARQDKYFLFSFSEHKVEGSNTKLNVQI